MLVAAVSVASLLPFLLLPSDDGQERLPVVIEVSSRVGGEELPVVKVAVAFAVGDDGLAKASR